MAQTVLVTGGTGYIAGELIGQLLARGWTVRTTVRDPAQAEPRLRQRFPDAGERLAVFAADLLADDGWAEAVAGCTHVVHLASPFPASVPKNEDELVRPAREGTLRALRFARDAGVRRFVHTSSAAAIAYGQPRDKTDFDESDWTDPDAPGVQPYIKSKTLAERAAREWITDEGEDIAYCSINPVAVLGPVHDADFASSVELVSRLLAGQVPAIPDIGFGVVDVRDVAALHVLALEAADDLVGGERFAASAGFVWMADIAALLRSRLGPAARRVPRHRMPTWLLRLMALFSPTIRLVAGGAGQVKRLSSAHAQERLGWTVRPVDQTLLDTAHSLIERGVIEP
jgi:dihydroflavonol-4-reductase